MYHCLEITEILEIIIEFAIQELGGRRTILSLSGTCRTLRGPSLDYYWRTQESLAPLLRFIPPRPCIEEIRRIGDISRTYVVSVEGPSDWSSFIKNAARIQSLRIHSASSQVAYILHDFNEDQPTLLLLPNICQLKWQGSAELLPLVHLFLGPKLSSFSLEIAPDGGVHPFNGFVNPNIITVAPFLTEVHFFGCDLLPTNVSGGLSDAVCRMGRLRSFSDRYHDYTAHALFHLASISTLQDVSLTDNTAFEVANRFTRNPNEPFFRALRNITITEPRQSIVNHQIFKVIQSCQLKSVTVHVLKVTAESLRTFLSTLGLHRSSASLSHLNFRSRHDLDLRELDYRVDCHITLEIMQPLSALVGLECLDMGVLPCLDLGDDDVKELAMSLPRLKKLVLGTAFGWRLPSRITLLGLAPFAEYCPELTDLEIVVDTRSTIPDSGVRVGMNRPNNKLRALNLSNSSIEASQVPEIAALISELFPGLGYIVGSGTSGDGYRHWQDVRNLVEVNREKRMASRKAADRDEYTPIRN